MLALTTLALAAAPATFGSHSFPDDVPDTHPFHNEIGTSRDTNITVGCSATAFCPSDYVRRHAMAAFIDRALGLLVRPGETTQRGVPGSRVEMLDDDLSFVGTEGNALRVRGPGDNVVGGYSGNRVTAGIVGATIGGGGNTNDWNVVDDHFGTIGGGGGGNVAGGYIDSAGGFRSAGPRWRRQPRLRRLLLRRRTAGGRRRPGRRASAFGHGRVQATVPLRPHGTGSPPPRRRTLRAPEVPQAAPPAGRHPEARRPPRGTG